MVFAVVLTANHYLLDVVVGIALVLASRVVALRLLPRGRMPRRRTPSGGMGSGGMGSDGMARVPPARHRLKPLERQP